MICKRQEKHPSVNLKVANNIRKLVSRGYITEGVILTLISFFFVPKRTDNIRIVFYATVSQLNDYLWDKKSMLPSMGSVFIMVGLKAHMVDLDVGEFFSNFQLSLVLAKYCGVDLGYYMGRKTD